ncbi:MAG: hypothetical protein J6T48_05475 [Bacteroidales bacterium]|nr:hypothetical protein [Bacteroidales bacterium]
MKKYLIILFIIGGFFHCISVEAQSYSINNNQQQININVPVIEKPVYIEKYRTVYVDKPRKARKLEKPALLLGYLWVYPEDLGSFKQIPVGVINSINAQNPYGRDNWRIPTPDELAVLEANAEKVGLGDDIYLATDHCNGTLRLVATDIDYSNCIKVGNTYWAKANLGAVKPYESGSLVTYEQALKNCPKGYRLPTKEEFEELIASGKANFGKFGSNSAILTFPLSWIEDRGDYNYTYHVGQYWTSTPSPYASEHDIAGDYTPNYIVEFYYYTKTTLQGWRDVEQTPEIEYFISNNRCNERKMSVRYVLDK